MQALLCGQLSGYGRHEEQRREWAGLPPRDLSDQPLYLSPFGYTVISGCQAPPCT